MAINEPSIRSPEPVYYEILKYIKFNDVQAVSIGIPKNSYAMAIDIPNNLHDPNTGIIGMIYEHGVKKYYWNDEWFYQCDLTFKSPPLLLTPLLDLVFAPRGGESSRGSTLRGVFGGSSTSGNNINRRRLIGLYAA